MTQFGPYTLVRPLGRGGMAETFVATRVGPANFAQEVCIKRILPTLETDATFTTQFEQEARVSTSLRHANIVSVLDFGVAEGLPYLALELVDGLDLHSLLEWHEERKERMTSGLAVYIAVEIASALEHAHGKQPQSVVHRDISPSNVLVSRAGEVKLSDFGIAKVLRRSQDDTSTVTIKGKVPYMAPEYALEGRFDARSDLFALGVMLYEILAGRRPFDGRSDLDTITRIQEGKHVPLGDLCPTVSPGFVAVIERLIASSADARFQSASELLDALVELSPPPTARKILGELVKKVAPQRRSEPSMPAIPLQTPGVSPNDPTRTRDPGGALLTDRTPEMPAFALTRDPAMTRTALGPDALAAIRPTMPEERTAVANDPAVRAAFEASQRPVPETRARPRRTSMLGIGVIAGAIAIGVAAIAAWLALH